MFLGFYSIYEAPSTLVFGLHKILLSEGVLGDLLGPLLFSIALSEALLGSKCTFTAGYLDDNTLGNTAQTLVSEIKVLKEAAYRVGFTLNHSKCEIIGLSEVSRSHWSDSGVNFIEPTTSKAMLLGAPLHTSGFTNALNNRLTSLAIAMNRLNHWSVPHRTRMGCRVPC